MKTCSQCNTLKENKEFYVKNKNRGTLQSKCKECHNIYCINRWIEKKKKAIEYKGGKCVKCSYNKYYGALEFHHLDPNEKDMDWDKMRKTSWEKIKKELDKCVLLCSNCHREEHHQNRSPSSMERVDNF